jgi:hypothetical protein
VSIRPCASIAAHRFRPESEYAAPRIRPGIPESTTPASPLEKCPKPKRTATATTAAQCAAVELPAAAAPREQISPVGELLAQCREGPDDEERQECVSRVARDRVGSGRRHRRLHVTEREGVGITA